MRHALCALRLFFCDLYPLILHDPQPAPLVVLELVPAEGTAVVLHVQLAQEPEHQPLVRDLLFPYTIFTGRLDKTFFGIFKSGINIRLYVASFATARAFRLFMDKPKALSQFFSVT